MLYTLSDKIPPFGDYLWPSDRFSPSDEWDTTFPALLPEEIARLENVMGLGLDLDIYVDDNGQTQREPHYYEYPESNALFVSATEPAWNHALARIIHLLGCWPGLRVDLCMGGLGTRWIRPRGGGLDAIARHRAGPSAKDPLFAQFGKRHRVVAPSLMYSSIVNPLEEDEYPLDLVYGLFNVHLALYNGDVTASELPEVYIDCPGSEYAAKGDANFGYCPRINLRPGYLCIEWNFFERWRAQHGCGTFRFPPRRKNS